jgi:hypothetical protein
LPLVVELDQLGAGMAAEVALGRLVGDTFEPSGDALTRRFEGDRRQVLLFTLNDGRETMRLLPELHDWTASLDVPKTFGERHVRVRLLKEGKEVEFLDASRGVMGGQILQPVVLDSSPPDDVAFIELRKLKKVEPGDTVRLKARGKDDESGIRQVEFFVGEPKPDGTLPNSAIVYPGRRDDTKPGVWTAEFKLPPWKTPIPLGVRFVNGAGLTTTATITTNDLLEKADK